MHEAKQTYGIAAQWVVNLDETGIFYGAAGKTGGDNWICNNNGGL